jgi:hypothetical protein
LILSSHLGNSSSGNGNGVKLAGPSRARRKSLGRRLLKKESKMREIIRETYMQTKNYRAKR